MPANIYAACAAISAAIAVSMGAFAAHGLKPILSAYQLDIIDTGVQYQFYHALALLVVAWMHQQRPARLLKLSAGAFLVGTLCFSGSLYLLALTGIRGLGVITPIGGVAFIIGWFMVATHCWQNKGNTDAS